VVPISNPEAKRFSCGLVGLKGELAARTLAGIKDDPSVVSRILDPTLDVLGWLDGIAKSSSTTKPARKKTTSKASPDGKAPLPTVSPKIDWVIQIPQSWRDKPHRKKLRYFIPEWDDLVDPDFDFLTDTHSGDDCGWTNAVYAHQLYPEPNYDGLADVPSDCRKEQSKIPADQCAWSPPDAAGATGFPRDGGLRCFRLTSWRRLPPYSTADVP
jgi:hypothetical protein